MADYKKLPFISVQRNDRDIYKINKNNENAWQLNIS